MALDFDIKTSLDEETHDNCLVTARAYGFKTRAEWVRWLIARELSWSSSQLHIKRLPDAMKGHE